MNATGPVMVPVGTPRRVFVIALILGGVGMAIASMYGAFLAGGLFIVGLALGAVNNLWTTHSILKHTAAGDPNRKKFALASLRRLGYISLIAVVMVILFHRAGVAVLGGLALFHLLAALANSALALKELRKA